MLRSLVGSEMCIRDRYNEAEIAFESLSGFRDSDQQKNEAVYCQGNELMAVSYTHLTLPTIYSV